MTATHRPPSELKQLSVLIATCCIDMMGFAMVLPLLPFYALKLQATPEVIGLMTASFSVAQLVSAPLLGALLGSLRPPARTSGRSLRVRGGLCDLRAGGNNLVVVSLAARTGGGRRYHGSGAGLRR